jgi:WD40 repeat protein
LTQDGVVRVFNASDGRLIASSSSDYLDLMAINPEGDIVALPDALGRIDIFDLASAQVIRTIEGSWFPVWMHYNSPSILMLLQEDRTLSFIDSENGRTLLSLKDERFEAGSYKHLSFDGRLLAILQLEAGSKRLYVFPLSADGPFFDLGTFPLPYIPTFSPDGKIVVTIQRNHVILWDIPTREVLLDLEGLGTAVGHVTFTPDGRSLLASTGEIWELESGQMVDSFLNPAPSVEIRSNGKIILSRDGQLWDLTGGESLGLLPGIRGGALHFGFYRDGALFYWQSAGGIVEFWGRVP